VILRAASAAYGAAAVWRRRWYGGAPGRQRVLARPVISIGNLRVGGSGKSPTVAHVARLLVARGERPAVLSRGYARREAPDGVTVVSDGTQILADVARAGDEPLMLARELPGVPVLVGAERYLCGRLAEERFGATVHLLDDGFQHLALARDVDLLLTGADDLADRPLPAGHLREPLAAASAADAALVDTDRVEQVENVRRALAVDAAFRVARAIGEPRWMAGGGPAAVPVGRPIVAVAAIARPQRFFDDLTAAGWTIARSLAFRDHHWFTDADIGRLASALKATGAAAIVTTAKDAVRLEGRTPPDLPLAVAPLTVTIEPPTFADWLLERVHRAAGARRTS
jgi:tetraacyldisaccharide 4'-kinase